jgi:hypothetical protein
VAKAGKFEKYLRPEAIATAYGVTAICYLTLVSLVFVGLVHESILDPTAFVILSFAAIAFVPATAISLAYFLRPGDPLSLYLTSKANVWRSPLSVSPDNCTLKAQLKNGAIGCVSLTFYYPAQVRTKEMTEWLYTCTHAGLALDFDNRNELPSFPEIEKALEASLDSVASQYNVPVLFCEIHSAEITEEVAFSFDSVPVDEPRTGTLG